MRRIVNIWTIVVKSLIDVFKISRHSNEAIAHNSSKSQFPTISNNKKETLPLKKKLD